MRRAVVLLLALVLALLPAAAGAERATPFNASGEICLAGPPTIVGYQPTPTGAWVVATGEVLSGTIADSTWDDLDGALVTVTVLQERSFFNFVTGTFTGRLTADFTIGESLAGSLKGTVRGAFSDPAGLPESIYASSASVQWAATDSGTMARGTGDASFAVAGDTFCGPVTFSGVFK